jgi:hypothetical protein
MMIVKYDVYAVESTVFCYVLSLGDMSNDLRRKTRQDG